MTEEVSSQSAKTTTISLKDYQIPLNPKVREILANQLLLAHSNNQVEAATHLDRILESLKIPPKTSICRVNLSENNTREQAIQKLTHHFQNTWDVLSLTTKESSSVDLIIQNHKYLSDVVEIIVDTSRKDSKTISPPSSNYHCSIPISSNDDSAQQQLLFREWPQRSSANWPMTHRVIICDRYCAEAVLRGSHIFVKGILCADAGIQSDELVAVYGHLEERNKPTRGSTMKDYLQKQQQHCCLFLGIGKTHCSRAEFFSNHTGVGVTMTLERAAPLLPPLHDLSSGVYVQNLPSVLVGHALDPQPGDTILDMCCAPGGKTSHVANLMLQNQSKQNENNKKGLIVACEKSRKKVLAMHELLLSTNTIRNGVVSTRIQPLVVDSTKCVNQDCEFATIHEVLDNAPRSEIDNLLDVTAGFPPSSFDRILLDPPCSALGLRPKLRISIKEKELTKHAEYQQKFLRQAVELLKPGGFMTYSTCTFNAFENEVNVAFLLREFGHCIELVPLSLGDGRPGLPGHGLSEEQRGFVRRFDPSDMELDCMGFFIAKFQKKKKEKRAEALTLS